MSDANEPKVGAADHPESTRAGVDPARVQDELAALGEASLDEDERALFRSARALDAAVGDDDDVRTLATLIELSSVETTPEPLTSLERHRVWRKVSTRLGLPADARTLRRGMWRALLAGVAMAASVAVMVRLSPRTSPTLDEEDRAAVEAMGEQARRGLQILDPRDDSERAADLAAQYARRMKGEAADRDDALVVDARGGQP